MHSHLHNMTKPPMTVKELIGFLQTDPQDIDKPVYMARDPELNSIYPIHEVSLLDIPGRPLMLIPREDTDIAQ